MWLLQLWGFHIQLYVLYLEPLLGAWGPRGGTYLKVESHQAQPPGPASALTREGCRKCWLCKPCLSDQEPGHGVGLTSNSGLALVSPAFPSVSSFVTGPPAQYSELPWAIGSSIIEEWQNHFLGGQLLERTQGPPALMADRL